MNKQVHSSIDDLISMIKKDTANSITGIFYQVPANQSYPYIHINNINIKKYPVKNAESNEVILELSLFSKSLDLKKFSNIYEILENIISTTSYMIISNQLNVAPKTTVIENKFQIRAVI